jgi:hypothetical protein
MFGFFVGDAQVESKVGIQVVLELQHPHVVVAVGLELFVSGGEPLQHIDMVLVLNRKESTSTSMVRTGWIVSVLTTTASSSMRVVFPLSRRVGSQMHKLANSPTSLIYCIRTVKANSSLPFNFFYLHTMPST